MRRIYKYTCPLKRGRFLVEIPSSFQLLDMQAQGAELAMWSMVSESETTKTVELHLFYTGHDMIPEDLVYVKTVQQDHTGLVFHVFTGSTDVSMKLLK